MREHTKLLLLSTILGLVTSNALHLQNDCVKQKHFLRWNLPKHYPCPVQVVDNKVIEPAVDVLEDDWDHPKLVGKTLEETANVLNLLLLKEKTFAIANVANLMKELEKPLPMKMNDQIQKNENYLIPSRKALKMTWYNRMF